MRANSLAKNEANSCFFFAFSDGIPCTVMKNWSKHFRLCRIRDCDIRNMPTSRPSYRITPDWSIERHLSEAHRSWHDSYLLIPSSPISSSYAYGIYPESRTRARYRNTQSICMLAHTYVRGACNTWGYNTRDESALSENARGLHTGLALYLRIYVSFTMAPTLVRSMGYLEMGPRIM